MKMTSGLEFDPYDYYKKNLKEEVNLGSQELIDKLTKESNVDINLNKDLSKKTKDLESKLNEHKSRRSIYKGINTFLIVLLIVSIIVAIFGGYNIYLGEDGLSYLLCLIIGALLAIASFIIIFFVLRKKIKEADKVVDKALAEYNDMKNKAWNTLDSLRKSLNFKQYVDFVNNLDTSIKLDYEVDLKKVRTLEETYNLNLDFGDSESVCDVYSGLIDTNPFLRVLLNKGQLVDKVYTGSRVVTWTERVSDGKGGTRIVHQSETLVASYTAKAPMYSNYSVIIYGNAAAPNLNFSRYPSGLPLEHDEKDVEKLVEKRTKKIEEYAEKAVEKGKNFTALANNDFDALFYAIDRDNETEFRLLFTPLAQQNMVELMTATDTYGDDFSFVKKKKLNFILSNHSQRIISFDYTKFNAYYDYEELKSSYITDMNEAFYSLYFDLAPILAVPLYQMHEAPLYDGNILDKVIDTSEAEAFINHMDRNLFRHKDTDTEQILKVSRVKHYSNSDLFKVTSHSYKCVPQVTYIPVACRNGRVYDVKVNWFRYDPLVADSLVAISKISGNKSSDTNTTFKETNYRYHNFVSIKANDDYDENKDNAFANYINMFYNKL